MPMHGTESPVSSKEQGHGPPTTRIVYRGLRSVRSRMQPLLDSMPTGAGRQDDGALYRGGHGLRSDLPTCFRRHGPRQRERPGNLHPVCRHLRGLCQGMQQAPDGPLPGLRSSLPSLCRRMPSHVAGRIFGGPVLSGSLSLITAPASPEAIDRSTGQTDIFVRTT